MNYKNADKYSKIFFIISVMTAVFGAITVGLYNIVIMTVVVALCLAGIFIKIMYYRCKSCNRLLPGKTKESDMENCPYCGKKLQ